MALKVPDDGALELNDALLAAQTYTVHLYQNNFTPVAGSLLADFTAATFNSYAAQPAVWGASVTVGGRATANAAALTWTKAAGGLGNSIYGYYVTDAAGELVWAERDGSAPVDMNTDGRTYTVTPQFTLKTEF